MNLLLTGADGQLGAELRPLLKARGSLVSCTRWGGARDRALDLSDHAALAALLDEVRPAVIVNAAAYTAVDRAESEPEVAHAVNGDAPGLMARWAASNNAALLHFSTDYVFDGRKASPYLEDDPVAPINAYGNSKLDGENQVIASACKHLIMRTSWVYASHGQNFPLKMLQLARERDQLQVVSDQMGRPTWAANLARYAIAALDRGLLAGPSGILHAADAGACSWFEFAGAIFDTAVKLGLLDKAPALREVGSDAFPTAARRPASSVLATGRLRKLLAIEPMPQREALAQCLAELPSGPTAHTVSD